MKETISRRITKTASVMIILVLLIGGTIYFRTVSNAENLDNRNLRELTRIGQGVEGRVNNLKRVMENLAGADYSELIDKEKLIPNFKIDTSETDKDSTTETIANLSAGKTAFKTDLASSSLQLWHRFTSNQTIEDSNKVNIPNPLSASYGFESLRPILSSDYMETIFLADETGSIFIWETERTGIRIHELAALDTLYFKGNGEGGPMGKSDILQTTIAGQEYRFYLHPVRVHLSEMQNTGVSESEYSKWILGGIVSQTEYGQKSLSLDPNMALFLGFLVIAGFLIVPFVRILTMGPKERLRVGNLFYLVIALIFGAGLAGLWMADIVHYSPLNENTKNQLKETADHMALNIDSELQAALNELTKRTNALNDKLDSANLNIDSIKENTVNDSLYLMREKIEFDATGTYPYYHMVFWTDSEGMQKAKWTPRANNTTRINVDQREYFKAIAENRGWDQKFYTNPDSSTCNNITVPNSGSLPYYIESIRSWNTGENVAAISIPWGYKDSTNTENSGIAAITTELASLTTPVLPVGVGFAVVDANAQTLFHTRQERILDENFAEETDNGDLLRSILAARTCAELEMNYEGQSRLMSVRPLNGRPLFLILFKDLSLIDTVRFEAWFEGGTLLGIWVFMIFLLIFFLERLPSSRMDWIWPDLKNPGKYTIFTVYSIPFIVLLILKAMTEEHLHIHEATLIIPIIYLGIGLVILYHGFSSIFNGHKSIIGWALVVASFLLLGWLTTLGGWETTRNELLVTILSLAVILVWLSFPRLQEYINRWSNDLSPRGVYTVAMVSGLLVLGLLPGYTAYRFTFHDHSEHLVKYHQLELAESLQHRQTRISDLMQDTWEQGNWFELKAQNQARAKQIYDLAYKNLFFETLPKVQIASSNLEEDSETDLNNSIHDLPWSQIPFLTDASLRMRQPSSQQTDLSLVSNNKPHVLQPRGNNPEFISSKLLVPDGWFELKAQNQAHIRDTYDLVYKNLIFETQLQAQLDPSDIEEDFDTDLHNSMHGLLGNQIPFLTAASISMRQLSSRQADRSWVSNHKTHELQLIGSNSELITSKLPAPVSLLNLWPMAILLTLIGFLCLIVYRFSRRMFFMHLEHSDPLALEDVLPKQGESWSSTIFVGTRSISRQPLIDRSPEIHYIDLVKYVSNGIEKKVAGDVDKGNNNDNYSTELLKEPLPEEAKVICLDYFDHRIDETERNQNLLEFLETYMSQKQALPVLLLTSRELNDALLTANISKEKKEEIKHRWDRILGHFSKTILSDYVSEKPFETLLQVRIIQKITDSLNQLWIDLVKSLSADKQAGIPPNFDESLVEMALKTEWLYDELKYLASSHCTFTNESHSKLYPVKTQLEILQENIVKYGQANDEKTNKMLTAKQKKWLKELVESTRKVNEQINKIIQDKEINEGLNNDNQAVAILSSVQFLKKISIWFLFDSAMEARRVVYRDKKKIQGVYQTLVQECGHHQRLQEIGEQLTYRPDWHTLSKKEIVDLVREGAEAHYRARWSILSPREQLVAAQLSRGAVVNPKSHQAISRLFARGLIRRSPELRLDNVSFSDFVESTVSEDQLLSWERAGIPSTWEMIRAPLVIALIVVALFLFWSQREFLGNTIAFLGTIGVGAGAIFNLLSKFGNIKGSSELNNSDK